MAQARHSRLVFFRVNYPHWWGEGLADRVLRHAFDLPADAAGHYRRRRWYTGEFSRLHSGHWFFKLGKSREDLTHSTVQAVDGHYVFPEEGEGPVVPIVRCVYAPERKLLIGEVTGEITHTQIKGSLEAIIHLARDRLLIEDSSAAHVGSVNLQPLTKKSDFYSWARDLEQLRRVSFRFWPTNPNPRRSFENWDEAQREARADETRLELKNKSDGLKVDSELVSVGISQVHAGYGVASASGTTASGLTRTWHSVQHVLSRVVQWFDGREDLDAAWTAAASDAEGEGEGDEA